MLPSAKPMYVADSLKPGSSAYGAVDKISEVILRPAMRLNI